MDTSKQLTESGSVDTIPMDQFLLGSARVDLDQLPTEIQFKIWLGVLQQIKPSIVHLGLRTLEFCRSTTVSDFEKKKAGTVMMDGVTWKDRVIFLESASFFLNKTFERIRKVIRQELYLREDGDLVVVMNIYTVDHFYYIGVDNSWNAQLDYGSIRTRIKKFTDVEFRCLIIGRYGLQKLIFNLARIYTAQLNNLHSRESVLNKSLGFLNQVSIKGTVNRC